MREGDRAKPLRRLAPELPLKALSLAIWAIWAHTYALARPLPTCLIVARIARSQLRRDVDELCSHLFNAASILIPKALNCAMALASASWRAWTNCGQKLSQHWRDGLRRALRTLTLTGLAQQRPRLFKHTIPRYSTTSTNLGLTRRGRRHACSYSSAVVAPPERHGSSGPSRHFLRWTSPAIYRDGRRGNNQLRARYPPTLIATTRDGRTYVGREPCGRRWERSRRRVMLDTGRAGTRDGVFPARSRCPKNPELQSNLSEASGTRSYRRRIVPTACTKRQASVSWRRGSSIGQEFPVQPPRAPRALSARPCSGYASNSGSLAFGSKAGATSVGRARGKGW